MEKQRLDLHGQIPIELIPVLDRAYTKGFSVQSDFYRDNAVEVALCASLGFITTLVPGGYGSVWRITPKGMKELGVEWP
jgi:hypothetical protein